MNLIKTILDALTSTFPVCSVYRYFALQLILAILNTARNLFYGIFLAWETML